MMKMVYCCQPFVLCLLAIAIVATNAAADPVVVDLSRDFAISAAHYNQYPGARTIRNMGQANPLIRTVLVLEDGQVVAEYTRDGVDTSVPQPVWSATKSWLNLILGMIITEDELLSLDEALGEIFEDPAVWEDMTDVEFRQAVTIKELLTMTSGFRMPGLEQEEEDVEIQMDMSWMRSGGSLGGASLSESLSYPTIGDSKLFNYLAASNILSYVILERTGLTPREYLADRILPYMGMDNDDLEWWQNQDGVEYSYHGMSLTSLQMAKWGQLYLQQGKVNATMQLIDPQWIDDSTSIQGGSLFYGYLMWVLTGEFFQQPNLGTIFCATGLGGQDVCVSPLTGRVVVQQRDLSVDADIEQPSEGFDVATVALSPDVSFSTRTGHDHAGHVQQEESDEPNTPPDRVEDGGPLSDIIGSSGTMRHPAGTPLLLLGTTFAMASLLL